MSLIDPAGRPVVRLDSVPAQLDGPFVLTVADPDMFLARLLTDNAEVQQALAAGIVELVGRQFGQGATAGDKRKRGMVPTFADGEAKFCLRGEGTRGSLSGPIDDIGSTQGSLLHRSDSLWKALGPGASGYLLKTLGAAANPLWAISPGAIPLRARVFTGGAADVTNVFSVLDGTSYLDVTLVGSGGGGAQANASTAGNISIGFSGGGGSACRHFITAPSAGYGYTLGAYGGNAQQGSSSTMVIPGGTDLVAPGGGAGSTIGNSNTLAIGGHTNGAATASGGSLWNRGGKACGKCFRFSGTVALVGNGGTSPGFGPGGIGRITSGVGEIGHGFGGGGSGGLAINGAGAQSGGHGAPSALIVIEYASAT